MPFHSLASRLIKDLVPHIFKRSLFTVTPDDTLYEAGRYLALEGRIYFDGFPVRFGDAAVGRIASYFIIKHAIESESATWADTHVASVMDGENKGLESTEPLAKALDIFERTKLGFIPVATNGKIAAILSVRDLLRIVVREGPDTSVRDMGSPLVTVNSRTSLGDALGLMMKRGIRNLVVNQDNKMSLVNDRSIMEYLVSNECLADWKTYGRQTLFRKPVSSVRSASVATITHDASIKEAASKLSGYEIPALLVNNGSILSPWDLTMKWLLNG